MSPAMTATVAYAVPTAAVGRQPIEVGSRASTLVSSPIGREVALVKAPGRQWAMSSHERAVPAGDIDYERAGGGYALQRRPDPRIAVLVHEALGSARTI